MTTDEKAKAYDEALEQAKKELATCGSMDCDAAKQIFRFFPQLVESEDERIRAVILKLVLGMRKEIFTTADELVTKPKVLAYLEKQKENPKSADSIPSDCVSDAKCEDRSLKHSDSDGTDIRDTPAYWKGWDDAMKQKEQNHPNGCFTCDEYKKGYEAGRLNGFTAGYNKAMKEVDQKEQKPWKVGANAYFTPEQKPAEKQDYSCLNDLDRAILRGFLAAGVENVPITIIKETAKECLAQMKPAEWSEEDERIIDTIVSVLGQYIDYKAVSGTGSGYATPRYSKEMDWLKSLRPPQDRCKDCPHRGDMFLLTQGVKSGKHDLAIKFMNYLDENRPEDKMSLSNGECEDIDKAFKDNDWAKIIRYVDKYRPHWRPSEEQMEALAMAVTFFKTEWTGAKVKEQLALESLCENLKKLI